MAAIADVLNRSDILAPRNRHELGDLLTAQETDIIRRREYRSAYSAAEPRRFRFQLLLDSQPVEFAYSTCDATSPPWIHLVFQSLAERWGDRPGWDGYDARPTNPDLVVTLLNILAEVMTHDSVTPRITPLADGGVQAEWHRRDQDLEIVVPANDPPAYYYFNFKTNLEEESEAYRATDHLQALIGLLS